VSRASFDSCLEEERADAHPDTIMLAGATVGATKTDIPKAAGSKGNGRIPEELESKSCGRPTLLLVAPPHTLLASIPGRIRCTHLTHVLQQ